MPDTWGGRKGLMIKRILLGLGGTPFTDVAIERAIEIAVSSRCPDYRGDRG